MENTNKINEGGFKNFSQVLFYRAEKTPDKIFLIDLSTDKKYSFFDFNEMVNQTTQFLKSQGVSRGDIISLCLKNSLEFLLIYFASIRLGSIINPIPGSVGKKELIANMEFLKPSILFWDKTISSKIDTKYKIFTVEFDGKNAFINLLKKFSDDDLSVELHKDSPACLFYSSGTTAEPKGILFSHRGIMNVTSMICKGFNHNCDSVHLGALPMGHAAVVNYSVLSTLYVGGTFVFSENFMKIREDFWNIIEKYKVNYVQTVPTVIFIILNTTYSNYQKEKLVLPYIACGSAPLSEEIKKSFEDKFGLRLANLYGLSEVGHLTSDYPFVDEWQPGSIGRPLDNVDIKIFDDFGNELKTDEVGELAVKTPGFFMGYYQNQKLHKSCFKNNYFYTGDLGRKDKNGLFYHVGRKKDLIIKAGVNISPNFIDEVLIKHSKVAEAATIGKPDKFFGEIIKSFIVLKPNQKISEKDLITYCAEELGDFRSPSEIEFVDNLPKTASGKILKRKLA